MCGCQVIVDNLVPVFPQGFKALLYFAWIPLFQVIKIQLSKEQMKQAFSVLLLNKRSYSTSVSRVYSCIPVLYLFFFFL